MPEMRTATKPTKKASGSAKPRTPKRQRRPKHEEISRRAYFIHLEEGCSDAVGNWLRAERELTAS